MEDVGEIAALRICNVNCAALEETISAPAKNPKMNVQNNETAEYLCSEVECLKNTEHDM